MDTQINEYVLELQNISKAFPGVKALSSVDMNVEAGEVHALVGENGAGKSTLMKILSGVYRKDSGTIIYDGRACEPMSPHDAQEMGISIIHQELNLFSYLSVAENIYIGRLPRRFNMIQWSELYGQAQKLLDDLGIKLKAHTKVNNLSIAQKQMVEIAKAISRRAKVVIMDEPTSSITDRERKILFNIIHSLKEDGVSIIYISHKLDEIFEIASRITILRDGSCIGTYKREELNREELVAKMIGRKLTKQFPTRDIEIGDVIFKVVGLGDGKKLNDISFHLRAGEVLGFSGIVGSGRTETMRLIFGADRKACGEISVNGQVVEKNSPRNSIDNRIGFVTENRREEGLILPFSVKFNTTVVAMRKIKKHRLLNKRLEIGVTNSFVKSLNIVTPSIDQKVALLSGGNQQKVVLAKWLFSDFDVIILDEPTRGIDVGAKREIYDIINELASRGKGVIVVSSEMEEIMGICDRVLVMREGKIVGEVNPPFSQKEIASLAVGV